MKTNKNLVKNSYDLLAINLIDDTYYYYPRPLLSFVCGCVHVRDSIFIN